ncbi:MAG: hypothetical protein M3170_05035 [Candidatus Dormibacteraeota bacterium]|nr:hypothetical protein [Candidatus Dormibacteraeota bacterium]
MIRVARVWAHRSPSGPSFRRQFLRVAAGESVLLPLRTSGAVISNPPPAGLEEPPVQQPLEERQPTQRR